MLAEVTTSLSKGPAVRNSPANASPSQLEKLGRDVRAFSFGLYKLRNLKNVPADMRAEYRSILNKVSAIESTITKAFGSLNAVAKWAGLSGPEIIVPLAMYGTIVAGVIYGSKLIAEFIKRFDARQLMNQNPDLSYDEALDRVTTASDTGGIFGTLFGKGFALPLLAIGGVIYLLRR